MWCCRLVTACEISILSFCLTNNGRSFLIARWRPVGGTCVLDSDFGFTLNCQFRKSSMFRVRNLGGVKGYVGLGKYPSPFQSRLTPPLGSLWWRQRQHMWALPIHLLDYEKFYCMRQIREKVPVAVHWRRR